MDQPDISQSLNQNDMQALYNEYHNSLYSYVRRLVAFKLHQMSEQHGLENGLAEDIVQETFIVWARRTSWNKIENPKAFLHTIARNLVNDVIRRLSKRLPEAAPCKGESEEVLREQEEIDEISCQILFEQEEIDLIASRIANRWYLYVKRGRYNQNTFHVLNSPPIKKKQRQKRKIYTASASCRSSLDSSPFFDIFAVHPTVNFRCQRRGTPCQKTSYKIRHLHQPKRSPMNLPMRSK